MRRNGKTRLGNLLLIAIVALVMISGVVFLARSIFGGGSGSAASNNQTKLLTEPADNTVITMNVRGPITAKERHYDIAIELSASQRRLVIYKGYDKSEELKKIELDNSSQAFKDFLLALSRAGFVNKTTAAVDKDNGLCAGGQIIDFGLLQGDQVKYDAWTTSCSATPGNFTGNNSGVINLLLGQIPDARSTISSIQSQLGYY